MGSSSTATPATPTPFGRLLSHWRKARRLSQEALAADAEISSRHLSFLETGRSRPGQQVALVLASALELPLRERNALLQAAGFAPAYEESHLDGPEAAPVRRAVEFLLEAHAPYPAVAVDPTWNLLQGNPPFHRLWPVLMERQPQVGDNLLLALFDPAQARPYVTNLDEIGPIMVRRLARQALVDPRCEALLDEILAQPGVPQEWRRPQVLPSALLFPIVLERDGLRLSLFSTIATLGTAADVATEELYIEHFFPADAESEATLRSLAQG